MINLIRKKVKFFQQILAELTKEVKVSKKALFVIALSALCLVFIRYLTSFNELILFLELVGGCCHECCLPGACQWDD